MSFIFYMIRRIMENALRKAATHNNRPPPPTPEPSRPSPPPPSIIDNVIETLWIGMTTEELQSSFGKPRTITSLNHNQSVWEYINMNGTRSDQVTYVTIQDNKVVSWEEK